VFRFVTPSLLALVAVIPAAYLLKRNWAGKRWGALRYSSISVVVTSGGSRWQWVRILPDALRGLALALFVVALARPQTGITSENVTAEGIDIVLVLDVSTSMLAEDLRPNRLEAAKSVATEFVSGRNNDRIGLVAFAGEAVTQAPLTLDVGVIASLTQELEAGMLEDGTAVGMGLGTAVKRLELSEAPSKVVILLTDGRNNTGEIGPLTAARIAQALEVRVYTIGVGGTGPANFPITSTPRGGPRYQRIQVDLDEGSLGQIAELTGGRYFRATDEEGLLEIYREIDQLERTEIEVDRFTRYQERFQLPLLVGLALILLEGVLRRTWLRRLP